MIKPSETNAECHVSCDDTRETAVVDYGRAAVIELRVRNHPGTMSHITGLFARRAFNLEAIVCVPVGDASESRVLLLVADEPRLEQVERQLEKLHDVLSLKHRPDIPAEFFAQLARA